MAQNQCVMNVTSFDLNKAITFSKFFNKIKLSASARLVLRCLIDFWNPNKGLVYPGQNMLAECTGVTRRSVVTAIEELRLQNVLLTEGESGRKLKYFFTAKFFECAEISHPSEKISQASSEKISPHEQKNHEQKKNKVVSFNSKMPYRHNTATEGIQYKTPEETVAEYEESIKVENTLNLWNDKETALKALESWKNNPIFAKKVKELQEHWGLIK